MRFVAAFRASRRAPLLQVGKSAVAIGLSWLVASLVLQVPLPIFAAIAALLVVQPSVNQSLSKGVERSIGVVIGVAVASLVTIVIGAASWVVLVAVAIALAVGWLLKITAGTSNQVAISAMLVLALSSDDPNYSLYRIIETLIGAVLGIVVNALIVPPVHLEPARGKLALLGGELAASLVRLADALESPRSRAQLEQLMIEARLLRPMRDAAESAIADGLESLTLNPRRSRHRDELLGMQQLLEARLTPIVTQVTGMTRAFIDRYDDSLVDEPAVADIAEQLRRAAHDVRLAVHLANVEPEPITSAIPALTKPLRVETPESGHWVLIGSLLEDLRRIRLELVSELPPPETAHITTVDRVDGGGGLGLLGRLRRSRRRRRDRDEDLE
ncbi:FUSC family protein [Pseudoclavibacter endophyticus]|uniref:FUSC family protein n=1 Tax=Pseudoclavibacter endophyticus TaxID=1778590 RepID=A0A6H9WUG5_9MICO|nr:FUSC family protein [Pseudoclavibacter endophyticus]KAB1650315.1 FUSC family protein [Pseudoclavibacter endophyticus]